MYTLILKQIENGRFVETLKTTGTLQEIETVEDQLRSILKTNEHTIAIFLN